MGHGGRIVCSSPTPLVSPEDLGRALARRGEIWQMRSLDARGFTRFAVDRSVGVGGGPQDGVERLWRLGLLRADVVRVDPARRDGAFEQLGSEAEEGLRPVGEDGRGRLLYADGRGLVTVSVAGRPEAAPVGVEPLFHPFRLHVLHYLQYQLGLNITPLSTLTTAGTESYGGLVERIFRWKDEAFASESFAEEIRRINDRTALAVVTEPVYYPRLFGRRLAVSGYDPEEVGFSPEEYEALGDSLGEEGRQAELRRRSLELFDRRVVEHKGEVLPLYGEAGLERVEEARRRITEASEVMDPNRNLQNLLRVSRRGPVRLELEGAAGGAVVMRTMAEMLRRAAEDVFDTELPEEDETGFVVPRPGFKRRLYGSDRLLDDDRARGRFLKRYGLEPGLRISWYTEGETEYGAVSAAFGAGSEEGVRRVNLRSRFGTDKKRDVPGFRDALLTDMQEGNVSFVSIDSEHAETLRSLRAAREQGKFYGSVFEAKPDIEIHNFGGRELGEIFWRKAAENGAPEEEREALLKALEGAESGNDAFDRAHEALPEWLEKFEKGEEWGRRMMAYAMENRQKEDGTMRPLVEAVELAFSLIGAAYEEVVVTHRVEHDTGRLEPLDSPTG